MTTTVTRRDAARAIYSIREYEHELKGRDLADDFLITAYALSKQVVLAGLKAPFGGPVMSSAWAFLPSASSYSSSPTFSDEPVSLAKKTVELLEELGDRGEPWSEYDKLDREIVSLLAQQYNQNAGMNSSAVGRRINRSHTVVDDRKRAWCARVMNKLRAEWPDWFGLPYASFIADAKKSGATNQVEIAKHLTERGIPTPRGKSRWHAKQVARLEAA